MIHEGCTCGGWQVGRRCWGVTGRYRRGDTLGQVFCGVWIAETFSGKLLQWIGCAGRSTRTVCNLNLGLLFDVYGGAPGVEFAERDLTGYRGRHCSCCAGNVYCEKPADFGINLFEPESESVGDTFRRYIWRQPWLPLTSILSNPRVFIPKLRTWDFLQTRRPQACRAFLLVSRVKILRQCS